MIRKVTILFLTDDFLGPEGGTEQHLLFLLRELPRDLFNLHFAVLTGIRRMTADDFPIRPVMFDGFPRGLLGILRRLRSLAAFIRTNKIDVVHAFGITSEFYACLAVKLAGRGKVLGVRRSIGYWHTWRSRWVARFVSILGADYATNCEAARDFVVKVEWIGRHRMTVIPNPAPMMRLQDGLANLLSRSSLGIADDEQVVGMVATVRPIKDYGTFLRAAALVLDEHPRTRFLVIGTEQPEYKAQMVQLARELGIDGQVSWVGPLPNPFTVVPLFDVAILSSQSEAMSNAILEYMAAGIATVATDVGGTREILEDGQTGFLVPSRNPDMLAERVCQLLADPALCRRLGDNARHKAETQFAERRVLRAYHDLYFRMAGGASAIVSDGTVTAFQSPAQTVYPSKPAKR